MVDGQGKVVAPKTAAFLQAGPEKAFADLEQTLRRALAASSTEKKGNSETKRSRGAAAAASNAPPSLQASGPAEYPFGAGCTAQLDGLASQPALNGCRVEVLGYDTSKGRFMVKLLEGQGDRDEDGASGAAPKSSSDGNENNRNNSSGSGRVIAVRPCSLAPLSSNEKDGDSVSDATAAEASEALSNLQSIEAPPSVGFLGQVTINYHCGLFSR